MTTEFLCRKYSRQLLNYLKSIDPVNAEDLCQDVLLKAHLALPALKDKGKITSWLFSIARNHAFTALSKKKRDSVYFSDINPDDLSVIIESFANEREWLRINLNKLSKIDKEIVSLRIYGMLKLEEIAVVLGLKASTVRSRMSRIPAKLRRYNPNQEIPFDTESFMNKIEHIKDAAFMFEQLSLINQELFLVTVLKEISFSESLLRDIAITHRGQDFINIYGKTLSLREIIRILNYVDGYTEKRVITGLESSHPEVADQIKRNLFVLEDIILLDKTAIDKLWNRVDEEIMLTAIISLPASVRKHVLSFFNRRRV